VEIKLSSLKNPVVILQARIDSSRFPNKILQEINYKSLLEIQIRRILMSNYVDELIVAIPDTEQNDGLERLLLKMGIHVSRGPLNNVFERFRMIIEGSNRDNFVRLTADCPLFMPKLLDEMYLEFVRTDVDYMSNCLQPTFPDGLDIEIFKKTAFLSQSNFDLNDKELEHVTLGIWTRPKFYKLKNYESEIDLSNLRMTVDYQEDFDFVRQIFNGTSLDVDFDGLLRFLHNNPEVVNLKSPDFRNIALKSYLEKLK
jgi:spore coat polysaccharide biosynthesis protein SpsF (cytidylyltransferase family)